MKNQEFEVKYLVIRRSEVTNLAYAKETNYPPQEKIANAKLVMLEPVHVEPTPAFVYLFTLFTERIFKAGRMKTNGISR